LEVWRKNLRRDRKGGQLLAIKALTRTKGEGEVTLKKNCDRKSGRKAARKGLELSKEGGSPSEGGEIPKKRGTGGEKGSQKCWEQPTQGGTSCAIRGIQLEKGGNESRKFDERI